MEMFSCREHAPLAGPHVRVRVDGILGSSGGFPVFRCFLPCPFTFPSFPFRSLFLTAWLPRLSPIRTERTGTSYRCNGAPKHRRVTLRNATKRYVQLCVRFSAKLPRKSVRGGVVPVSSTFFLRYLYSERISH